MRNILALGAVLLLCSAPSWAADPAGRVKSLDGRAVAVRGGAEIALSAGADIYPGDRITTKSSSKLGLVLIDDTVLSLGPNSDFVVERMVFEPEQDKLDMGLMLKSGTFSVQSGQIAKLAPVRADIRTPQMSIGIRGTAFLVEVDDE